MNIGKCASTLKFFLRVMADVWTEFVDIGGEVAQPSSRAGESIYASVDGVRLQRRPPALARSSVYESKVCDSSAKRKRF